MNTLVKISTLLLSLTAAIAFSGSAFATVTPNGGTNWGGTQGINTPALWTQGHGNVVGSHFMRMMSGSMNPNGMLMQHHFANHDGAGATNPALTSAISGMHVMNPANNTAGNVVIDLDNFVDPSFGSTFMRIEVLSFAGTGIASIDSVTATDSSSVVQTGSFSQAGATWTNPAGMMSNWDYAYADYEMTGAASAEQITISSLGSNIGQVFVWTEQVAAVPVPAAVWLFGSAIFGLFSVSRRRDSGAAMAA